MASFKLPTEFKTKWLRALRSKRYKQTTMRLRRVRDGQPRYCCLGVGCKIENKNVNMGTYGNPRSIPNRDTIIPIMSSIPSGISDDLVRMNDEVRLSFEKIADWIEENL